MSQVYLQFYSELNDFLAPSQKNVSFVTQISGRVSIKDLIESLGVPHPEVERMVVNGVPVDFSYLVQDGDCCQIYPVTLEKLRNFPKQFVLDVHLGKLAGYLRMLGFDTLYRNDYDDEELAQISSVENRTLLTRDIGLLKRSLVTYGYFVRSTDPTQQLAEVLQRFDLLKMMSQFSRCIHCNGGLVPVEKQKVLPQLPPKVRENYHEFRQCSDCRQVFWKGTHYDRMQEFMADVLKKIN
jgi:uncharacterized protein with PIN domain